MNIEEQIGEAKRHLLAHRGEECEECREARMTLRRFSPLTEEQRDESYRMAVDAAYGLGYKAGFDAATDDMASVEGALDVGEDEDCAWCGHPKGHHHEFVRSGVTGLLARSEDHAYVSTPSAGDVPEHFCHRTHTHDPHLMRCPGAYNPADDPPESRHTEGDGS